jgi:hypothetical protein
MSTNYEVPHCATSSILLLLHPSLVQLTITKCNKSFLDVFDLLLVDEGAGGLGTDNRNIPALFPG